MSSTPAIKAGGGGGGKGKGVALPEGRKRAEGSGKFDPSSKQKSVTVTAKTEVKAKTAASSSKTVTKTKSVTKARAVKKVYSLPGQKFDIPEEREPLRIFYESLSKQIPSSEMAEFWLMEHGLLSPEKAKKAYERKQKRQQQLRMGTPIKSTKEERPTSIKKPQVSKNGEVKPRIRIRYSDDDDDDFKVMSKKRIKI